MSIVFQRPFAFQDEIVPEGCSLVGTSALVQALGVAAPVRRPCCVSERHVAGSTRTVGKWKFFDRRYRPEDTLAGHLTFALKHEDADLLVWKRIFDVLPEADMAAFVIATPAGIANRRAWFFYETLTGRTLDIDDAKGRTEAVDALDPSACFTAKSRLSKRHRVRDNLLGTGRFCPVIRRTPELEAFVSAKLGEKVGGIVGRTGRQLIARAASFLLLADSRASFEIEGERAPVSRLERWGRAVLQAGRRPLSVAA
ncbi:MAG: hypothetical protein HQL34_05005 [Alphaproteobacteria bacterium]|nr:hypothetical protein [Alphaproteobacteria bacterium]